MKGLNINKTIVIFILAVMLLSSALLTVGCAKTKSEDQTIIDGIVDRFMPLTKIPRQSKHEEEVSNYLFKWAEKKGFNPTQDEENNVLFDVPATAGMENKPMAILQAHMDMVITVADGKAFDPQKDSIKVINDGETLKADGTSLGADDGIGIATIMYFIENNKNHGPLRVIITTDEEDGMNGVRNLDAEDAEGAKYVLNLDYEWSNEACNSSAAGCALNYSMSPEITAPQKDLALQLEIKNLLGGHSGIDIHKGHLNAIKALGLILKELGDAKVDFELANFIGGNAKNAIPSMAEACIVVSANDEDAVRTSVQKTEEALKKQYGEVEEKMVISVNKKELPANVLSVQSKSDVVRFANELFDGVYSMSDKVEGLVESSSNFGVFSVKADDSAESTAISFIRSSSDEKFNKLIEDQTATAQKYNFEVKTNKSSDAWPVNTNSKLVPLVQKTYKEVCGEDIKIVQVHAGLECGTFTKLNPELDIISLGFDIANPHSINETLTLSTIPTTYKTLEGVLANLE